jgi:hypothetical protein
LSGGVAWIYDANGFGHTSVKRLVVRSLQLVYAQTPVVVFVQVITNLKSNLNLIFTFNTFFEVAVNDAAAQYLLAPHYIQK